jgi:hypothetical protein
MGPSSVNLEAVLAAFRNLQRKLERLASRLAQIEEEVDAAAKVIENLVRQFSGLPEITPRLRTRRSPEEERLLRAEAHAGATITVETMAEGWRKVRVNGREPFRLSPTLASLLAVLVAPPGQDGLPAWSTKSAVAEALANETGRAVAPGGVSRLVYKLRQAFEAAGENVFLIETNRAIGAWRVAGRRDRG